MENVQHAAAAAARLLPLNFTRLVPAILPPLRPAVSSDGAVGASEGEEEEEEGNRRRSRRELQSGGKKHLSLLINIAASPGERRHRLTYFHRVIGREDRVALAPDVPTLLPIQMMTQGSGSIIHGWVLERERGKFEGIRKEMGEGWHQLVGEGRARAPPAA